MRVNIKTKNLSLTSELKKYTLEKIGSLSRFFKGTSPDLIMTDIELSRPSKHHRKGDVFRCEVNVSVGKHLLRAEEEAGALAEAVDLVRDEIQLEIKKFQSKRRDQSRRAERKIIRRRKFSRP